MLLEELAKHLWPVNDFIEETLYRPVAAAFSRPAGDAQHCYPSGHTQHC